MLKGHGHRSLIGFVKAPDRVPNGVRRNNIKTWLSPNRTVDDDIDIVPCPVRQVDDTGLRTYRHRVPGAIILFVTSRVLVSLDHLPVVLVKRETPS